MALATICTMAVTGRPDDLALDAVGGWFGIWLYHGRLRKHGTTKTDGRSVPCFFMVLCVLVKT